jgi:hypothetical protein
MKTNFLKTIFSLLIVINLSNTAKAQLSFPNGNTLNLISSSDYLYLETRIFFHTGMYKSDDYLWEKISDSININWSVSACFNGDCKNDLLQSGNFIKDYGLNDTTGFIAFHVEPHEYVCTSVIKYKIYNKNNNNDKADLIFNISYTKTMGINGITTSDFLIYPNPISTSIILQSDIDLVNAEVSILNLLGETVLSRNTNNGMLDISELNKGIYFLHVKSKSINFIKKIVKQ